MSLSISSRRGRLASSASVRALALAGMLAVPSVAKAECVTSGSAITCDTNAPNPHTSPVVVGVGTTDVIVLAGAQIATGANSATAISTGALATSLTSVIVNGAISVSGDSSIGLHLNRSGLLIGNAGTIEATGAGGLAVFLDSGSDNIDFQNVDGDIYSAQDYAVYARSSNSQFFNSASATIVTDDGVAALSVNGDANLLVNDGLIENNGIAGSGVILSGDGNYFENASTGSIEVLSALNNTTRGAFEISNGGSAGNTLFNEGAITANNISAVVFNTSGSTSNLLVNLGSITSTSQPAIRGGDSSDRVENYGTIASSGGTTLIDLAGGDDSLLIGGGTTYNFLVDGGTGTDSFILGGPLDGAFDLTSWQSQVVNFEIWRKEGAGTWTLYGSAPNVTGPALEVAEGAIEISGSFVGSILADPGSTGISINVIGGGSVTSPTTPAGQGGVVRIVSNSSITNTGALQFIADVPGASGVEVTGSGNTVTNNGFIYAFGVDATGVNLIGGGNTFSHNSGGVIAVATSATGVRATGGNNTVDLASGSTINVGTDGTGIVVSGTNNVVAINGTIDASSGGNIGIRVDSLSGEDHLLTIGGTVQSTAPGTLVIGGAGNERIVLSGIIDSSVGTAVDLGAGDDEIVFSGPTAVINGITLGGTGTNTINLGTDASFDASLLGGWIVGFTNLIKTGGGPATLYGTGATDQHWSIQDGYLIGTAQSIQGNVTIAAGAEGVAFDQAVDGNYAGLVAGGTDSEFLKAGAGTLLVTGLIDVDYLNISDGALRGGLANFQAAAVNLDGIFIIDEAADGTLASALGGNTGILTKLGGGELSLGNAAGFTGSVDVGQGAVIADANAFFASNISTAAGSAFIFDQAANATFAGGRDGAGDFVKQGAGTLTLTNALSNHSGNFVVEGGTIRISNPGALGTAKLSFSGGALSTAAPMIIGNDINLTSNTLISTSGGAVGLSGSITGAGVLQIASGSAVGLLGNSNSFGTVQIASGAQLYGSSTSLPGTITNAGTLTFQQSVNGIFGGAISGNGSVVKDSAGSLNLTGTNTYTGGTTVLQGGLLGTTGSLQGNINLQSANTTVAFVQGSTGTYSGQLSGIGSLIKQGGGSLLLTGTNTLTGGTTASAGTLVVNGSLAGNVNVAAGATLGGSGQIAGTADLSAGGILAPGNSPGTLMLGSLVLGSGSVTNIELANPAVVGGGVNDLIQIAGNLTLDGTLNVTALPGFGAGSYTFMTYGGALTDNGMVLGNIPVGYGGVIQTSVAGQVRFVANLNERYWDGNGAPNDGNVAGGTGVWSAAGNNWTNVTGLVNGAWDGTSAVFAGAGGTVDLVDDLSAIGLHFAGSYSLASSNGSVLTLNGGNIIVDATQSADMAVDLNITNGLTKSGNGALYLGGTSTITGGTTIQGGSITANTNALQGNVVNNGTLNLVAGAVDTFTGDISGTGGLFKLGAGNLRLAGTNTYAGGTTIAAGRLIGDTASLQGTISGGASTVLNFDQNTDGVFNGTIAGGLALAKNGTGTVTLNAANAYTGVTSIFGGTIEVGHSDALGTGNLAIFAGGTLRLGASSLVIDNNIALSGAGTTIDLNGFDGEVSGDIVSGVLNVTGSGTLDLTGANAFNALVIANPAQVVGTTTSISGPVTNNGGLGFVEGANATFNHAISGTGFLYKDGAGELTLAAANSYTGGTFIADGAIVGSGAAINGDVVLGAVTSSIVFDEAASSSEAGVISGVGTLEKRGTGTIILTGANSYTGNTFVTQGTLLVNGGIADDVVVASGATFGGSGSVGGLADLTAGGDLTIGTGVGTLNLGSLSLGSGSVTTVKLANPSVVGGGVNDLFAINGDLVLDGTLDVTALAGFTGGSYTFMTYGGVLSDNGMTLGAMPAGYQGVIQTAVAGQINLIADTSLQFWDGSRGSANDGVIDGGTGNWSAASSNWTNVNGTVNAPWTTGGAVFAATGGTVTLVDDLSVTGLQFTADGYRLTTSNGSELTLAGGASTNIQVDGAMTTTIDLVLAGATTLTKQGTGTLVLLGDNTYTGGTTVVGGTLVGNASSIQGDVLNDARLIFDQATTGSFAGDISGSGSVTKQGSGTLQLAGTNSYTGGTTVRDGTLSIASGVSIGSGTVTLDGGALSVTGATTIANNFSFGSGDGQIGNSADVILSGVLSGSGGFTKLGEGNLTLTGANTYTGGTTVLQGTLTGDSTSLQGDIVNHAELVFAQTADGIYDGALSGTGSLAKTGQGNLTLAGANSYSGGTTVTAGTLTGDTNSLQGAIANNAALVFDQTFDGAYAGDIVGSGSLTKDGTGLVSLAGTSSHSGGTFVLGGTLAGTTASLQGNIVNDATVLFVQSNIGTYDGIMSGSGELVKRGNGELALTGANSYSGGTVIEAGTLSGDTSSLQGAMANDGTLLFVQPVDGTFAGAISGTGDLVKQGAGVLTLSGANSYSGDTLVEGGTVSIGSAGNIGSGTIGLAGGTLEATGAMTLANAVTLGSSGGTVLNPGDVVLDGVISGTGALVKQGGGVLTLNGANTNTGGIVVEDGVLIGDSASLRGAIANQASVVFEQDVDGTYAGVMSGAGSLTKLGTGVLTVTGANTYSGGTTVSAGTLAGNSTSLQGTIVNNSVVAFSQATNGAYGGAMSGAGLLTKIGAGSLDLTGTSSFTGQIDALGGLLAVNGSWSSAAVNVAVNGRFGGSGTIGNLTVAGTVAPGNSIGTLTVTGDLVFLPGSGFEVELNQATGDADLLEVTGTADLAGTVNALSSSQGLPLGTTFRIINAAGGVNGTFSGITLDGQSLSSTPFLTAGLEYSPTAVDIVFELDRVALGAAGSTPNQLAVGAVVSQLAADNDILEELAFSDVAGARAAFDLLSGEIHADVPSQMFEDGRLVREALLSRTRYGTPGGGWLQVFGNWGEAKGDANVASVERSTAGFASGVDLALGETAGVGFAVGYTDSKADVDLRQSEAEVQTLHVAAYASAELGNLAVRAGGIYGSSNIDTTRSLQVGGFADVLNGEYDGSTLQGFIEVGYNFDIGRIEVEPFANLTALRMKTDAFAETGGLAALDAAEQSDSTQLSTLGFKLQTEAGSEFELGMVAGWRHAFGTTDFSRTMSLQGAGFSILGAPIDEDAAVLDLDARWHLSERVTIGATYSGVFGSSAEDHAVKGAISIAF